MARDDVTGGSPVWLLDVDGVINTIRPGWGAAPRREHVWSPSDAQHYVLRWAPALLERIRTLHSSGVLEVRWCTTWCPDAEQLERLWELPPLPRALSVYPMPKGPDCWALKRAAAHSVLAEGRPLVWTDDDAIPPSGPDRDALTDGGRALLIVPRSHRGLQPDHLDEIETFASRWRQDPDDGALPSPDATRPSPTALPPNTTDGQDS